MSQTPSTVSAIADAHRSMPGGLLPALHAVQDALGHVPDEAVPLLAQALGLSRAEVHGVLTYYHHFRRQSPGRQVVQVCSAEACQSCGSEAVMARAEQLLACRANETRADGGVTLETVYCLGLCATAPAVQIDGQLHAGVTPDRLAGLLAGAAA